jgi:hypothetical protein
LPPQYPTSTGRPGPVSTGHGELRNGAIQMLDVIMLAIGLAFFALSVGYAYACERL